MRALWKRLQVRPMEHPGIFRFVMNCWPPYLGAAIRVEHISPDWQTIKVGMKQHWYNSNYVRSHFGGSLFAMTDPFYMLMLLRNMGNEYIVWDTGAEIRFQKPGKGRVSVLFRLDDERLTQIREKARGGRRVLEKFEVAIVDEHGEQVATVNKTVYIRKKPGFTKRGNEH